MSSARVNLTKADQGDKFGKKTSISIENNFYREYGSELHPQTVIRATKFWTEKLQDLTANDKDGKKIYRWRCSTTYAQVTKIYTMEFPTFLELTLFQVASPAWNICSKIAGLLSM